MNALEITKQNIKANGFRVGKAVRGKGYELFEADYNFFYFWGLVCDDKRKELQEKLQNVDINSLYISDIYYINGKAEKRHFQYEDFEMAQSQVSLKELIASGFEGVSEAQIKCRPSRLLGYFPISSYKSDLDSQKEMIRDLLELDGRKLYSDELFDYDDEWQYDDNLMSFNSDGYNGDYALVHGLSYYMDDKSDCEYINGKPYYHNSLVVEDFWQFEYEECMKPYLDELDPKDKICVYHRKGKDWYVGYQYESEEIVLDYREEDGEMYKETYYALCSKKDEKLIQKFVEVLESYRDELAIKSYIYNELEIGEEARFEYYNDGVVNHTLVDLLYEDKDDLRDEIMESIKWDLKTIKEEFAKAYHAAVDSRMQTKEDLTILIETVSCRMVTNPQPSEVRKFNHLKLIKRLEKRYGYELVKTAISDSLITDQWAIKQGGEEYHFDILDVITYDIDGTQPLKEFIFEVLEALQKRRLEKISQKELFEKASKVFVGIEDSIESGNCQYGTNQFILKHRIDTSKIGGIRGDVLLEMENSNFTKRAVNHAILAHNVGVAS